MSSPQTHQSLEQVLRQVVHKDSESARLDTTLLLDESPEQNSALLHYARDHKVKSVVLNYYQTYPGTSLPEIFHSSKSNILDFRKLEYVRLWIQLNNLLSQHGAQFIWLKGPLLSLLLYDDVLRRDYVDLDILIHRDDYKYLTEILEDFGFKPDPYKQERYNRTDYHQEFRDGSGHIIEVHTAVTPIYFKTMHIARIPWENLILVDFKGRQFPTFDTPFLIIYLCHHGGKHSWLKLQWVLDIALLIQSYPIDWEKTLRIADDLKQRNALLLGLYHAKQLFDITLPEIIYDAIRSNQQVVVLSEKIQQLYVNNDDHYQDQIAITVKQFIMGTWQERLTYITTYLWKRAVDINYHDRFFAAPKFLRWIYYVTRLLRLIYVYVIKASINRLLGSRSKANL